MVLIYTFRKSGEAKIGFSVSKKLGNAVMRNRVKRRLREAVTPFIPLLKPGCRLIFIAKPPILDESFQDLLSTVRYLLKKAELIERRAPLQQGGASVQAPPRQGSVSEYKAQEQK